jgi:hypothetical protein
MENNLYRRTFGLEYGETTREISKNSSRKKMVDKKASRW